MNRMSINHHFPRFAHEHSLAAATERRAELQRDIRAYLKAGGKIQKIPTGLSGMNKQAMSQHFSDKRNSVSKRGGKAVAKSEK